MRGWILLFGFAACAPLPPAAPPIPPPEATISRGSTPSSLEALYADASRAALVCVGEDHDDSVHHRFQLALLDELARRALPSRRELGLGMEMIQRPYQPAVDDYLAGSLDEAGLASQTEWESRWGFDFAMYRPLLELARNEGLAVLALNAPREITRWVAKHGLEAVPEDMRAQLPAMDLADAQHRRYFWAAMGLTAKDGHDPHGGHGHHGDMSPERYYAAQVIWDETMAQTAAGWLAAGRDRQLLVVAGNGHCHDAAIPSRVRRRLPEARTVSLQLLDRGEQVAPHATSDFVVELADDRGVHRAVPAR